MEALSSVLAANAAGITRITLEDCNLGGAAALAAALRHNTTVRDLSLNSIDTSGEDRMDPIFAALGGLEDDSRGRDALSGDPPRHRCGVTSLALQFTGVHAGGAAALGSSLRRGSPLESLDIYDADAGPEWGVEIGGALAATGAASRLAMLDIAGCKLGTEGARV